MVTCPNCGNVCDDKANFCIKCGYNLKSAKSVNMHSDHTAPNSTAGHNQPFVPNEIPSKKRKKKSAAIIAISLIAVFVLVGVIAFNIFTRTRKTIDLEKCVDVSFTGYNGAGSAIMTVNSSRLKEQIEAAKGKDAEKYDVEYMAQYVILSGTVKKRAASDDSDEGNAEVANENDLQHLSRGDTITITIDYAELQKAYNELEFSGKDLDVEVNEGLKDYKVIDPFLHIEPEFSGTAPFGSVSIKHVSDKIPPELIDIDSIYWYELNKNKGIDIGDVLVLKFTEEGKHSWKEKGLKPSREEMTYEVTESDLSKYVTKAEELSDDDIAQMQAEARDRVISYLIDNYNQKNVEYIGAYLMVPKKENWDSDSRKSFLYLVFKSQIENSDKTKTELWLVVRSSDIRKLKNSDKASDIYDPSSNNKVFDITQFRDVAAYDSEENMKNNLILKKSDYMRDPEFIGAKKGAGN